MEEEKEIDQTEQKGGEKISPESVETLKSQVNDFKLQKHNLEAALNIYKYDQKNILDVLALKVADGEKKIAAIDLNIEALTKNINEAE